MFGNLEAITFPLYMYCFAMYVVLSCLGFRVFKYGKFSWNNHSGPVLFTILAIILSVTCCIGADFFAYKSIAHDTCGTEIMHLEAVYGYLLFLINNNYFLFRVIVWGSAVLLVLRASERMGLSKYYVLFFLMLSFSSIFSYARASLAMAIFFDGVSFVVPKEGKRTALKVIAGIAIMLLSVVFHRSMLALVALALPVFLPVNRKVFAVSLVIIPIAMFFAGRYFGDLLMMSSEAESMSDISHLMDTYSEREVESANWKGMIRHFFHYSLIFIPMIYSAVVAYRRKDEMEWQMRVLLRFCIIIAVLSFSTFLLSFESSVMFYRFLYMAIIPLSMLVVALLQKKMITARPFSLLKIWQFSANLLVFCADMLAFK